ncbi:hypothetical protein EC957_002857 [Mortierella hygrophila]|uniref:Uncharacterized protein n=1 Tax=Mortierella hygrophila TaxID=979708 RepID=A0A9P6FG61_9FUNG|nr:hypothetical protein EC957_002857 [Mortierella hygrophila]
MLAKTIIVATLALAATVQAVVPNHTHFNDPVSADGDLSTVFVAGGNYTYSWSTSCASGEVIASNPTAVEVQLVKADNPNTASLVATLGTMDCSGASGHEKWVPPTSEADSGHIYSLRLVLGTKDVYSGKFLIKSKEAASKPATPSGSAASPSATTTKGSGASIVAPVLAGAAAVAAGALMFL